MGFCCGDCGDTNYTCTAWNGEGRHLSDGLALNHNLVKTCPEDVKKCEYRHKKIKAKEF